MVKVAGKYQHVETTNTAEFIDLVGVETTDERLMALNSTDSVLTVRNPINDAYSFSIRIGLFWERTIRFVIGEAFFEGEGSLITIVRKEGDRFIFTSKGKNSMIQRIYEFSDDGASITLDRGNGKIARRKYKRI